MALNELDIRMGWYYFCSIATQFNNTMQFVDHSVDCSGKLINAGTTSNEFAKILMLACSEFEGVSKKICNECGYNKHEESKHW